MFAKQVAVGLLLCGVLSAFAVSAHADNIKLSAVACWNYNANQALDADHLTIGVRNVNASPRLVICAFPRMPAIADAPLQFIVDGNNLAGTSTSCTVTVYDTDGQITDSQGFTGSGADWRRSVTFAAGNGPHGSYETLLCNFPGNGNGQIYGLVTVQ